MAPLLLANRAVYCLAKRRPSENLSDRAIVRRTCRSLGIGSDLLCERHTREAPPDEVPSAGAAAATSERSDDVKYMLLIYNNPAVYAAWSEQERAAIFAD